MPIWWKVFKLSSGLYSIDYIQNIQCVCPVNVNTFRNLLTMLEMTEISHRKVVELVPHVSEPWLQLSIIMQKLGRAVNTDYTHVILLPDLCGVLNTLLEHQSTLTVGIMAVDCVTGGQSYIYSPIRILRILLSFTNYFLNILSKLMLSCWLEEGATRQLVALENGWDLFDCVECDLHVPTLCQAVTSIPRIVLVILLAELGLVLSVIMNLILIFPTVMTSMYLVNFGTTYHLSQYLAG
jgi:hypothetical protein